MRQYILSKINPTQRSRIEKLCHICCQKEPVRLSLPLPSPGERLEDERFLLLYDSGRLVSLIHLFYPDHLVGELIGFTHPDFRNRGYFKRLLSRALDYAENDLGLEQVYLISDGNSSDAGLALSALSLVPEYSEYMLGKSLPSGYPSPDKPALLNPEVKEISGYQIPAALFSEIFGGEVSSCSDYMGEISSDSRIHSYILELEHTPVGQAQVTLLDHMAYLSGFGILPAFRRSGLGRYFLQTLESILSVSQISQLTLQVSSLNPAALSLYLQDGFTRLEALTYYPLFETGE